MNIELQLKNINNKSKDTYSPLSNEEIEEKNNQQNSEDNQINIDANDINDTKKDTIKEEIKLNPIQIINENIFKKFYDKIKIPIKKGTKKFLTGCFYCLFSASIYLYFESLAGCEKDSLEECLVDDRISNYVRAGIKLLVCCGIMAVILLIQILCKLTKINYILMALPYLYFFINYKGVDLKNHGTYNRIAFLLITPCIMIYFYIYYYMFYSFYKKKFIRATIILIIFILKFSTYFYFGTCEKFYKGLGGVDIENDRTTDKCYFIRPNQCSMKFLDPFFDMVKLKGPCTGRWNTKRRFMKYLPKNLENINHFYYPRIEHSPKEITFTGQIFDYVYEHIGGVKENPEEAKNAEVFLDFENDKGKISINLKRNETLIEERRAIAKKNEVKFDNVYVFFFDSLSRNHFIKRLKKISKLLEETLYSKKVKEGNNIENSKFKKMNSFQFIKYENLQGATFTNMYPLFYGVPIGDPTGASITKFYKDKGFITGNTVNSCYRDLYHLDPKIVPAENFDHENIPLFCDTNLLDKNMFWAYEQGENSIFRKCLYGKDSHEYMFEYMSQFLEAYKDERKLMRMCFLDSHEATQQVIKYLDDPLFNFLKLIYDKYYDEKTAIIFLSDHGGKLPGPYAVLFLEEWKYEQELSVLFLVLPENNTKYDKNIVLKNEKRFLSDYDVYHTLMDYINVDESQITGFRKQFGQSILTEIDGMKRDCDTVGVKGCFCHNYE